MPALFAYSGLQRKLVCRFVSLYRKSTGGVKLDGMVNCRVQVFVAGLERQR